jgi:hypothetical protein
MTISTPPRTMGKAHVVEEILRILPVHIVRKYYKFNGKYLSRFAMQLSSVS